MEKFPFFSYKNNIECEWTIRASPGNELTVSFLMLDIDETEHCNGDYLEIRDSNSIGPLIGVYCGRNIPTTLPQVNAYWLKFRSDNDGVGRGFLLEYSYGTSKSHFSFERNNSPGNCVLLCLLKSYRSENLTLFGSTQYLSGHPNELAIA